MNEIFIRRSVRHFTEKEVGNEKVEKLLRAAMQAPSSKNQQPWSFVVVRNKETLNLLSEAAPNGKPIIRCNVAIVLVLKEYTKAYMMTPQDMSAATQNILLEAVSQDLGTCWIGIYPKEERILKVTETLSIEEGYKPFSIIAVGYPDSSNNNDFVDRYNENRVFNEKWGK